MTAWKRLRVYVPGLAVGLGLYLLTTMTGGRFLYEERYNAMQALDVGSVTADPVGSLMALHSQPPLMNALFAATDGAPERLGWIMLAAMLATVVLVVDTVRRSDRGDGWAMAAGLAYALLPGTVLYSLFPYTTTLTALFAIAAIWGVALSRRWIGWGTTASAIGVLGLFLVRASFLWLFVAIWLVVLAVLVVRRPTSSRSRAGAFGSLAVVALLVAAVQIHYTSSFGTPTLSSWSAENLSNALIKVGLTDEAKAELSAQDPCYAAMLSAGPWQPVDAYAPCLSETDAVLSGSPVLDLAVKNPPSVGTNFNAGARLGLATRWSDFVRSALKAEPTSLVRIAVGSPTSEGSLALFLGRSDVYYQTLDLQKASQPWLWHLLGLWSAAFPFLAWAIVIAAGVRGLVSRSARRWLLPTFWMAVLLLVAHAVPSVLGDFGENQRFRAELDSVLMTAAVIGLGALITIRRATPADA